MKDLSCDEICSVEIKERRLAFDSLSTHRGSGPGLVLYSPDGINISLAFNLEFPYSKNESKYEALN